MTEADFDELKQATVCEPVVAGTIVPGGLTNAESKLYCRLLGESRGRLEQEFLPLSKVQQRIVDWLNASRQPPN